MSLRLTIIGAGPGGYVAAIRAAQRGARVTVVESAEVGGTCLNKGCIPTKTLVASAEMLGHVHGAAGFGIDITGQITVNLARIRERKDKIVSTQVKGVRALFKSWGVELIEGRASLSSARTVRIVRQDGSSTELASDRLIIATGSRPARIPGFPLDGTSIITSDEAVQLTRVPQKLLIVGAGVIGSEFAFIFRALGADVTVVELMDRALSTEDRDMSALIEREMKKAKIKLLTGTAVDAMEQGPAGVVTRLGNGQDITTDQVLVSIGRSLNSEDLGLESAGVATGKRGEIVVNDRLETNVPGIYAVGDVTGKVMLAHVASRQGLVAVDNIMGGQARMDYSVIPAGIFTMPEIGSVGIREQEAAERNMKYRVGRFQFRQLGKAHAMGEITGMVKIISESESDKVIGVHVCGAHATDLVHEGALAILSGTKAADLGNMIHAHPTLAEAVMEAAEDSHGMAIHVLKPDSN
jgi:dihydrolipoamide dehydrogenase